MSVELLPCPFCGQQGYPGRTTYSRPLEDAWWSDGSAITETHRINCGSCGGTSGGGIIGGHQTPEKAIAAWNTRAPAELTGWQPIETAPKDGAMFLIYVPTAKSRIISTSRGGQFWCQEDWAKRGGYTICDDHGRPVKATHWQPLPAPPGTTRAPADLRSALEAETIERARPGKIDPCEFCFGVTRHDADCRALESMVARALAASANGCRA